MIEILQELNKEVGVIGSLVVTKDGIVAASALGPHLDSDTVGALASNVIIATKQAMAIMGDDTSYRFILASSHGKMVFEDIGIAYLVCVTHQNIALDQILLAIKTTSYKIGHRRA
jgi:predicted regulator of Ras-like GTPase activity (Roadblock/LC7/MglB family)